MGYKMKEKLEPKILKWDCPKCDLRIISLYPKQFEYLKKQHNLTHEVI